MLMLLPIPVKHPITEKVIGKTVSMVPIDLNAIQSIDEDIDTKTTIIRYKSLGDIPNVLNLDIPFVEMVQFFNKQGLVEYHFAKRCLTVSTSLKQFIDSQK